MRLRSLALLAISGAALSTLVAGTALGLDRRVETWLSEATVPEQAIPRVVPPVLAPIEAPVLATGRTIVPAPAETVERPEVVTMITVPDLDGVRVSRARRTLRALGLRLAVRDGSDGSPISGEDGFYYRLRGATIDPPPGTQVEPGARIQARASAIQIAASGY